jgi:hypothetical protein
MPIRSIDKRISQKKINGVPKKILMSATGGKVYTSGSYKVHVFTSSDSFQVFYTGSASTKFEYFIVSGGQPGDSGGDGSGQQGGNGGNGGSGSWAYGLNQNVSSFFNRNTSYTVTVGGGGSRSSFAYKSGTIYSATDISSGGGGGQGEYLNDPDPPDPEGQPGGNGNTAVITNPSIDLGLGPYTHYCGGGGGGGGAGDQFGGQGGRQPITSGTSGDGGKGAAAGQQDNTAGNDGIVNSGDGGGGGGGGAATMGGGSYYGAAGGNGGSGIAFFKYQYIEL